MSPSKGKLAELKERATNHPSIASNLDSILRLGETSAEKSELLERAIRQVEHPRTHDL